MKFKIGTFEVEKLQGGINQDYYYECERRGDEKAAKITVENKTITDMEGDNRLPLTVLSVLFVEGVINFETFASEMTGRFERLE